jgi:predicted nucleotide-binding protein
MTLRKISEIFVDYQGEFVGGTDVTDEFLGKVGEEETTKIVTQTKPVSRNVFIVHGRDHAPMQELKRMLLEFGLSPVVLHEQPGGSRTIVEKLEKHSDVGYAFVILTPDDPYLSAKVKAGAPSKSHSAAGVIPPFNEEINRAHPEEDGSWKLRARQNVILEFGFFIGRLGRDRVCCLYKENVQLPSDMEGIAYIAFQESIKEVRSKIIKELKEVGYKINT